MSTIITRAGKGSPLTHAEVDANFENLNADKYQAGDSPSFAGLTVDTDTLYVDATNNRVGVGTTSPDGNLTVGSTTTAGDISVRIKGDATSRGFLMFGDAGGAQLGDIMYDHSTDHMRFRVNNAERLRINSSGNLGVGTTSPAYKTVISNGGAEGIEFGPGYTSGKNIWQNYNRSTSAYVSEVHYASEYIYNVGGSESMRIDSSGNVGIGASSPTAILTVQKNGDVFHAQSAASSAPRIGMFTNSSAGTVGLFASRTDTIGFPDLTFSTSDAERMRVDASGNLLVGTTTQYARFNVSSGVEVGSFTNTSGTGNVRFRDSAGSTIGYIRWSGSSTSYNTSSDYRLKEDVQPMLGASDRVLSLNPVNFAWKADGSRVDGFLAHEAQAVVPEAVTGEKDAVDADGNPVYQGIDQSKLVPLLTAALQEALGRITALEAQLNP